MTTEPFNDDPDHVPVAKFRPEIILGFIAFHRRFIIGTVLLLGVAYLLVRLNYPHLLDNLTGVSATDVINSDGATKITSATPSTEFEYPARLESPGPVDLDEEFSELLRTNGIWAKKRYSFQAELLQDRLEKLRSLLANQNLAPERRSYCEHNHIDIVRMLSEVSEKIITTIDGLDEMVVEVDKLYGQSKNKDLAAKASAVFVQHKLTRFLKTRSDDNFEELKNLFLARKDTIKNCAIASRYLAKLLCNAIVLAGDDSRLRELAIEHLTRHADQPQLVFVELAKEIFFAGVDLDTLPKRMLDQDFNVDEDMQLLLKQLKKHPDMPVPIYAVAVSSIQASIDNGRHEQGGRYLNQLREIEPLITAKVIRERVNKAIDLIKLPSHLN